MTPKKWILISILCAIILLALVSIAALASTDAGLQLDWWTVDGGGGGASGGGYRLNGTSGQPDAGAAITGGGYSLSGGFWAYAPSGSALYLPMVLR